MKGDLMEVGVRQVLHLGIVLKEISDLHLY